MNSLSYTDISDIYSINLAVGDELQLDLKGASGSQYELFLWRDLGDDIELVAYTWRPSYPKNISLAVPNLRAGTYFVEVWDMSDEGPWGNYTLTWGKTSDAVERLWGNGRYDTSAAISRSGFATSECVVLATGTGYADALAASGLAGLLDAPVLLIEPNGNSDATFIEIERLGATKAFIVGGTAAVSKDVEDFLKDAEDGFGMQVTRFAGAGRFDTAARVADYIMSLSPSQDSAFVVTGMNYADALAIAPVAYSQGMPVLLVQQDAIPTFTSARIDTHNLTDLVIAGGTSAVSDGVKDQLDAMNGGDSNVERWAGANRYATSAAVATAAIGRGWADTQHIGVANGLGFADALSGGAYEGSKGGLLLLTSPNALESSVAGFFSPTTVRPSLFGGTGALSANVHTQVQAALAE